MKLRLLLPCIVLLSFSCLAANWSNWNNVTVGGAAGNVSKWNNGTIGTTAGNIGAWNGLVSPTAGNSFTGNFGGTGFCNDDTHCSNSIDNGNSDIAFFTPFISPANATTWDGFHVYWNNAQTATWGLALYADKTVSCASSDPHCPGALICSFTSASAPSNGLNTPTLTGCGTPSSSTWYWIAFDTHSSTQNDHTSGVNSFCPGTGMVTTYNTSVVLGSWPDPAPAMSASAVPSFSNGNGCYAAYASINYTSSATYNIVSINPGACDTNVTTCPIQIPPAKANHSLYVVTASSGGANVISSVADAIAGSATDTLTKRGTCATPTGLQPCVYSIDRVSTGVDSVTCTFSAGSSNKLGCLVLEVAGTASSSSFDASVWDSTYTNAASYTSGNTGTTAHATEFLLGVIIDSAFPGGKYDTFTITPGTGWTSTYQGGQPGVSESWYAIFTQTVTSTGAYNVSGTASTGAGSNNLMGGVVTFQ